MNKIKDLRKLKKLTQQELAHETNIPYRTIQRWESGKSNIKPDKAQQLADYFEVSVGFLLGYEKEINTALYKTLPSVIQETDKQYENYLEVYNSSKEACNVLLNNLINALNPEQKNSFKKISDILIKLAGEIQKLETSSKALLELKDIQIKNITMKHEFEQFQNYFDN